jgi:hypothetical protein
VRRPRRAAPAPRGAAGPLRGERGSVTAEFAFVVPAVLVVLGLSVGAIMLSAHRLSLGAAAAEVARLEARGDTAAARLRLASLGDVGVGRSRDGPLLCVALSARPGAGALRAIEITARGCAAVSGAEG